MRRFLSRSSLVLLLLIVTLFYPLLAPPAHRIDKDHFELIQKGMTLDEVEAIFGKPPGNYDWAVADGATIRLWNVATGNQIWTGSAGNGVKYETIVVDTFSNDALWADVVAVASPKTTKTRYFTTLFVESGTTANIKTWTSRHGTCMIWFDQKSRVSGKTGWETSRVELPWSKWWKKCFGD